MSETARPAGRPRPALVLLDVREAPHEVEAAPDGLPAEPERPGARRYAWAVPCVVAVALIVYGRTLDAGDGPAWLTPATTVTVALTAALTLVEYVAQRREGARARGRAALLADPVRTTGTLVASTPTRGTVTFSRPAPDGTTTSRTLPWTLPGDGSDGSDGPDGSAPTDDDGPRPGHHEPAAVWYPARPDSVEVVLVRFGRTWADDLLRSVEGGESAPDDRGPADGDVPA